MGLAASGPVAVSTDPFVRARFASAWLMALGQLAACDRSEEPATPSAPVASAPAEVAIRVQVATAQTRVLEFETTATGKLHAFRSATIAAEIPGRITERMVERGEEIEERTALYRLDTKTTRLQLDQSKASEASARVDLQFAERELQRGLELLQTQNISRAQVDKLQATRDTAAQRLETTRVSRKVARETLRDGRVRAPFDGIVVRLHAEEGDYVAPGSPLVTLADLSRMRFLVGLTAAEAVALPQGSDVTIPITFDATGGAPVQAKLHNISSLADPGSGTYTAEFWLDQPEGRPLREGMVGQLDFSVQEPTEVLAIPRQAVVRSEQGFAVWVVQDVEGKRGKAELRPIRPGRSSFEYVEILSGLQADAHVIVDGQFSLAPGVNVELDQAEG